MAAKAGNYQQLWEVIKAKKYCRIKTLAVDAHNVKRGVINKKNADKSLKLVASLTRYQLRTKVTPDGAYAILEFWLDEYPAKRIEGVLLI